MERMVEHDVRAVAVAMTMSPLVSIVVMEANGMPELKMNVQMDLKVGVADLLQTLVGFQQASGADSISQDIVHPEPANPQAAHVRSAPNRLIIYDPPGPEMLSTSASPPPPPPPPLRPASKTDEFFSSIGKGQKPEDWEPILEPVLWNEEVARFPKGRLYLHDEVPLIRNLVVERLQHTPLKRKEPTQEIDVLRMDALKARAERMHAMVLEETMKTMHESPKPETMDIPAGFTLSMQTMKTTKAESDRITMQAGNDDETNEPCELCEDCRSEDEHGGSECKNQ